MKNRLFLIFLFLVLGQFSHADSYSSIQYHFSFTVPQGWIEIPKSKIDERAMQIANSTGTKFINYIAGFQELGLQDFGYPNMLLQYHDLQGRNFTWNNFVDVLANIDLSSGINNSGYKSFIDNFNTTTPFIDRSKKLIIHNVESTVTGVGVLRSIVILHLGKNGIAQLNITVLKNSYSKYTSGINNVIETLSFDYGYTFTDRISDVRNNLNDGTNIFLTYSNSNFDNVIK
jgi:hypothetical protein